MKKTSSTIKEIIKDAKKGKMFILVDNKDRENEGDLVVPASKINPRLEPAESVVNLIVTLCLVSHCSVFYDHLRLVSATPTVALKMTGDMHGKATRG